MTPVSNKNLILLPATSTITQSSSVEIETHLSSGANEFPGLSQYNMAISGRRIPYSLIESGDSSTSNGPLCRVDKGPGLSKDILEPSGHLLTL